MSPTIPKHPCTNKCSEFKNEPCNHCLIMANSPELESTKSDFLVGDAVVLGTTALNATLKPFDGIYNILEVYENTVCILIDFWTLTLNKKFIRTATVAELHANRRLTEAEHALAEVS